MKTKILGGFVGLALIFSPILVNADTLSSTQISVLQQYITVLLQLVELYKSQLAQLNTQQMNPPSNPVEQPVVAPIVVPPSPVFGNTNTQQPIPDLSKLEVSTTVSYDNGYYNFSRNDTVFTKGKDNGFSLGVKVLDKDGKQVKLPVTVTTNDPDIPFSFSINGQGVGGGFALGQFENEYKLQHGECLASTDCTPISVGTFTFTFTQADLNLSKTIAIEIK